MMTILSAQWANAEHTAAIVMTVEAGAVAVSQVDTPEYWATLLDSGVVVSDFVPPPPPKLVATPRQVRLALNATGMRQAIEDYVASQSQDVKDSWEFSTVFGEDHPLIIAGKAALGLSDQQMRSLFELAVTL